MKNFSEYNFKPSDVIDGLNRFYKKDEENKNCSCPPFSWRIGASKYACHFFYVKTRDGMHEQSFGNEHLEEAITWLREECDIFYTMGMKWEDLKNKMPLKACEKEYGTADIREMYPGCIIRPRCSGKKLWISSEPCFRDDAFNRMFEAERTALKLNVDLKSRTLWANMTFDEAEKAMNYCMNDVICTEELMREKQRIDGQEAIEGLRTLYYAVATKHERAMRRDEDETIDWPETSYMVEYIRKRVETADENVEYLCKENDELRNQVQNLKDLINRIHEDSDI